MVGVVEVVVEELVDLEDVGPVVTASVVTASVLTASTFSVVRVGDCVPSQ